MDGVTTSAGVHQATLFPDEVELRGEAQDALEQLDVEGARHALERASSVGTGGAVAEELSQALEWIEACGLGPGSDVDVMVEGFLATGEAARSGLLRRGSALRVDEVLARMLVRAAGVRVPFVGTRRLPVGAPHLVLGRLESARVALQQAIAQGGELRADVWGYLADVRWREADAEEAALLFGRALLLDPEAVDLERLLRPDVLELLDELTRAHGSASARERLLVEGWLRRLVRIPDGDPWFLAHSATLRNRLEALTHQNERARLRRFGFLLFEDRVRHRADPDPDLRLAMDELECDLCRRVVAEIARREREAPRLRWT